MKHAPVAAAMLLCLVAGCAGPSREELRDEAIAQFQVGRLDQARQALGELLSQYPSDPEGLYYMGRVCHAEGDLSQAIYYYRACLDAQPSFAAAQEWLAKAERETNQKTAPIRMVR